MVLIYDQEKYIIQWKECYLYNNSFIGVGTQKGFVFPLWNSLPVKFMNFIILFVFLIIHIGTFQNIFLLLKYINIARDSLV